MAFCRMYILSDEKIFPIDTRTHKKVAEKIGDWEKSEMQLVKSLQQLTAPIFCNKKTRPDKSPAGFLSSNQKSMSFGGKGA